MKKFVGTGKFDRDTIVVVHGNSWKFLVLTRSVRGRLSWERVVVPGAWRVE